MNSTSPPAAASMENDLNLDKLNLGPSKSINTDDVNTADKIDLEKKQVKPSAAHCAQWLQDTDFSTTDSESIVDSESVADTESIVDTESVVDSEYTSDILEAKDLAAYRGAVLQKQHQTGTQLMPISSEITNAVVDASGNVFKNISVQQSEKVYLGNVTNINIYKIKAPENKKKVESNIELEESIPDNIFIKAKFNQSRPLSIIPRRRWLAQRAIAFEEFTSLPKFVIICHTASESASTMAENVSLVRDIQTFHIESRKWSDIGYNFLIGEDGNVYEGRGWKRVGSHTFGVNKYSLGIAFVGCYMAEEAPSCAIYTLSALLDYAVKENYLPPDYQLVGHCQFVPYDSPGKYLYEIIQKHPNWEPNPVRPT